MTKSLRWIAIAALLSACAAGDDGQAAQPSGVGNVTAASDHDAQPAATGCATQTSCAACLAEPSCNWTGGTCAADCLQDVSCFGPRNPAAPTCPSPQASLLGTWQDEQSGAGGDVGTYVRGDLELGPSRFRKRFTFEPGGALSTNVTAPNDAHPTVRGTWSVTDTGQLAITYRDDAAARDITETYEIVESTDSVLRLRQLQSP